MDPTSPPFQVTANTMYLSTLPGNFSTSSDSTKTQWSTCPYFNSSTTPNQNTNGSGMNRRTLFQFSNEEETASDSYWERQSQVPTDCIALDANWLEYPSSLENLSPFPNIMDSATPPPPTEAPAQTLLHSPTLAPPLIQNTSSSVMTPTLNQWTPTMMTPMKTWPTPPYNSSTLKKRVLYPHTPDSPLPQSTPSN